MMLASYNKALDQLTVNFHLAGGDVLAVRPYRYVNGAKTFIDISGHDVVMKIENGPTITAIVDPDDDFGLMIVTTADDVAAIPDHGADFYIKDLTDSRRLRAGKVNKWGFL